MIVADTMFQRFDQATVADVVQVRLQVVELNVEEAVAIRIRTTVCDYVVCGQTALAARWYEDDDRLRGRVLDNGEICGLRHGNHKRREVRDGEAL